MTAYTSVMKAGKYEDEMIPHLAVHAFHQAFVRACSTSDVIFSKNQKLVRRTQHGEEQVLKDLSQAYVDIVPAVIPMKRKKRLEGAV
ncbi:hypothetical protein [Acinetobacter tianfuensis]|uniref:Uncharacterized protein n=1 Tax=Acinetobacter tianfuensis TaxID=2419603 RepID=A0A3A8E4P7_9GAMM|nr:hypothetical protein [Acinetobacter tianfuensis]RKG29625.1 hypothetical protein D7V32_14115 [Acinetobacter tianfuensis]